MPGANTMRKIARVSLVRVVAVLALVIGIALLQGTPCERDVVLMAQCTVSSVQTITAGADSDLLEGLGGVPEACLAALFVVLLALAGLRLPGLIVVSAVPVPMSWPGPRRRPEVRLTQLCVLRT